MSDDRWLIVGLGNPGPKYAATRHNAGALVVDELADRIEGSFKAHRSRAEILAGRLGGTPVVLAKPVTYMNESGGPVVNAARFFKVPPERIVLVHDDIELSFGTIRLKRGGGEGGHNGLRSASSSLGTKDYLRVRFGIGRPPGRQDPADYVLREFAAAERKELPFLLDRAADATEVLVTRGLDEAASTYRD